MEKQANDLIKEAKDILNALLNVPDGYSNTAVNKFVDCVVGAAVLTVTDFIKQAEKDKNKNEEK